MYVLSLSLSLSLYLSLSLSLTHTHTHMQGCCYNEGHNTCEVCYTEDTLDCAHVAHICAGRYAHIQVSLSLFLYLCLFFFLYHEKKECPAMLHSSALAAMRAYTSLSPPLKHQKGTLNPNTPVRPEL